MVARGTLLKVVAGILLLSAVGGGAYLYSVGSNFQQPTVQSVNNQFGTVTDETTEIETRVVVYNPNEESLPPGASLRYTVLMNDIKMATSTEPVSLQPGRNQINLSTELDNSRIPAWWVTHVNNGERTVLKTKPSITAVGLPVGASLPAQTKVIETSLLGSFEREEPRTVSVANQSLLRVSNQRAAWGVATEQRTPIRVKTDLQNVHDRPVELDGTVYRIEMNGIVVGNGTTNDSITLAPGESGTFIATPAIDTQRMQAWWVSHLQHDQTTRLSVSVWGLVEKNGTYERVPLTVYEREARLGTDFLGPNNTTVEVIETAPETADYQQPELVATESQWGEVRDDSTTIVTRATVSNPNEGEVGDLVTLTVQQHTAINDVRVASGEGSLDGLQPGNNSLRIESRMDHSTVPRWWARHLNNGERSTVTVGTNATADIGVTTLDVAVPDRERNLTTNLLDSFNQTEDEPVKQDGQTVLVVKETSATWGEATPQEAPIDVRATIENQQARAVTLRDITYTVRLNDVVLADNRTVTESYTVGPYAQRTITPTLVLNNAKMDEWWPTHVRNGERSQLRTTIYVTVESPLGTRTVKLDSLSQNQTVTTDVLG